MSNTDRAGESLTQYHDQLNDQHLASIGVGDGSGNLFVKGPYEAVKRVQRFILDNERLRADRQFNGLTAAEHERLSILMEEMAEATQVVGKILRHGYESHHPDNPDVTNRQLLEKELGDVEASLRMLVGANDVNTLSIDRHAAAKSKSIQQYLHHN